MDKILFMVKLVRSILMIHDELQNGGWILWNDAPTNFSVQADDDSTTPEKDGFTDEEIIWLATNDNGLTTYIATVTYAGTWRNGNK